MKFPTKHVLPTLGLFLTVLTCSVNKNNFRMANEDFIDKKIDSLLAIMTLEEKVGQMNLYNGFWDVTGPVPKEVSSNLKCPLPFHRFSYLQNLSVLQNEGNLLAKVMFNSPMSRYWNSETRRCVPKVTTF